MRRFSTRLFAPGLVLVAMLSLTPSIFARQDGGVITDPAPTFEDVIVTCGGKECPDAEHFQTYDVEFLPNAYVPELTYDEAMVVLVVKGRLAFRVQSNDVILDPVGVAPGGASTQVALLQSTDAGGNPIPVPFGTPPSSIVPPPLYADNGTLTDAECSRPPLGNLCLLDPAKFQDEMTFVELEQGDILYLPAGSTCFICNVTETGDTPAGDEHAIVQVWAPGSNFTWYDLSQQDNGLVVEPSTPTVNGSRGIVGWMLNPGSSCH